METGDSIRTVPALLRQHAGDRGDQIAFSDQRREITYAELERRTARIAGHLAGLGIRPGDRVAIACGNRVEAAESCLAVTRAAAVGVPLDPRASGTDLARVLRGSGARLVITDTGHVGNLGPIPELGMPVVLAGSETRDGCVPYEELVELPAPADPADSLDLDAPAWMMYTSGTTGHSKGVLSSQRAAMWAPAACYIPIFGLSPRDRLLWPLPIFHSYAHSLCILGVLAVGAGAHILGDEDLPRGLERPGITVLAGVPATFLRLVSSARAHDQPASPRPASPRPASPRPAASRFAKDLRACVTAGAPCPPRLRDDVRD
ncbi:MAG: AMP-binding protein, partial [Trebonia sp.]